MQGERDPIRRTMRSRGYVVGSGLVGLVALAILAGTTWRPTDLAAGADAGGPTPPASPARLDSPGPVPAAAVATAAADGLVLSVTVPSGELATGAPVAIAIEVMNESAGPLVVGASECGPAAQFFVQAPLPAGKAGKTWSGTAAAFKAFALSSHHPAGGLPADGRLPLVMEGRCAAPSAELVVATGERRRSTFVWTAELVAGVPVGPGEATYTAALAYADEPGRLLPSRPDWQIPKQLSVSGTLRFVAGQGDQPISAGEAIDAVLSDERFSAWLERHDPAQWQLANVFLTNLGPGPQGLVPGGPSWEIDLFIGSPPQRASAIAFVDPFSGALRNLALCDRDCGG